MGEPAKSEAEIEADEVIDTFAELVRQRDELRAELERVQANHVTVAEEIQRRHDACAPLTAEIERLRALFQYIVDNEPEGDVPPWIGKVARRGLMR